MDLDAIEVFVKVIETGELASFNLGFMVAVLPFPQTLPNLTLATETLYNALTNQRLRLYGASHYASTCSMQRVFETSGGFRPSKEKQ